MPLILTDAFHFDGHITLKNSQVGRTEVRKNRKVVGTDEVHETDKNGDIENIRKI